MSPCDSQHANTRCGHFGGDFAQQPAGGNAVNIYRVGVFRGVGRVARRQYCVTLTRISPASWRYRSLLASLGHDRSCAEQIRIASRRRGSSPPGQQCHLYSLEGRESRASMSSRPPPCNGVVVTRTPFEPDVGHRSFLAVALAGVAGHGSRAAGSSSWCSMPCLVERSCRPRWHRMGALSGGCVWGRSAIQTDSGGTPYSHTFRTNPLHRVVPSFWPLWRSFRVGADFCGPSSRLAS